MGLGIVTSLREPLYSCGKIDLRLLCAAALTSVLQRTTLRDPLNSQPPSFRMKWQTLYAPSSQGPRFKDVVVTSEMPFPIRRDGCARRVASGGSVFGDMLPGVVEASQIGSQLRANVHPKIARVDDAKFPVMNTCTKRVGGYPLPFSAFGRNYPIWRSRRTVGHALKALQKVRLFDSEEFDVKDKGGVWRDDSSGAASSVAKFRRNAQLPLAAYFHSRYSLIPSFDYLSGSELKHEWLAPIDRAIEFLAVFRQPTGVMHAHVFSGGGGGPRTFLEVPILQPGRGGLAPTLYFGWAGIIRLSPTEDRGEKSKKNKNNDVFCVHSVLPRSGIIPSSSIGLEI